MKPSERPNILWISLEDTSPRFGCYGDALARTPNLDRLAAGGCRFPLAFSTAGVCAPSRSAIITGMYQTSIGTHHMRTSHRNRETPEMPTPYSAVLPHYVKAFPQYLRAAGYFCTNNEKTDYQFDPPSTAWDELSRTAHWRNRPNPDQPFFAVFNPTRTHESGMWEDREHAPEVTDPDAVTLPPYLPDTPRARQALARQYDNIADSDTLVGQLLDQLEEDGLAENTIVFMWSDHGEGLPRGKRWPYDAGIRIPLIVRWPGELEPHTVSDQLVSLVDLGPTVLSLCGVDVPGHLQGVPFVGPEAIPREYIYAARDRHDEAYDMVRACRDARYKYIRNFHPELPYLLWIPYRNRHPILQEMWRMHAAGELNDAQSLLMQDSRPVEELYDTEQDPFEMTNLARDPAHGEVLERMRDALEEWRAIVGDMGEIPEDQMIRQWYPDGQQPTTATPVLVPLCEQSPGTGVHNAGGNFAGPCRLQLHCATQGASMDYKLEEGEAARWTLYTGPIPLPEGTVTVRARANRIGYVRSPERVATFTVVAE